MDECSNNHWQVPTTLDREVKDARSTTTAERKHTWSSPDTQPVNHITVSTLHTQNHINNKKTKDQDETCRRTKPSLCSNPALKGDDITELGKINVAFALRPSRSCAQTEAWRALSHCLAVSPLNTRRKWRGKGDACSFQTSLPPKKKKKKKNQKKNPTKTNPHEINTTKLIFLIDHSSLHCLTTKHPLPFSRGYLTYTFTTP